MIVNLSNKFLNYLYVNAYYNILGWVLVKSDVP